MVKWRRVHVYSLYHSLYHVGQPESCKLKFYLFHSAIFPGTLKIVQRADLFVCYPLLPYSLGDALPFSVLWLLAWWCCLGVVDPLGGGLARRARGLRTTNIARQMGPRPVGCGVTARQCCASHDICCGRFGPREDQSSSKSAIQKCRTSLRQML